VTCDDSSRFGDIRQLVNLTSCTVLDGKNSVAIKTFKYYADCPYPQATDPMTACNGGTYNIVGAGGPSAGAGGCSAAAPLGPVFTMGDTYVSISHKPDSDWVPT